MKFFERLLNSCTLTHSPQLIRYPRIKAKLINAAAGSVALAVKELAFESSLAARHLKRCLVECKRQYLVISALVASIKTDSSGDNIYAQAALQHASESVAASIYFAIHFARCNIAVISRIYEKFEQSITCAACEDCAGITKTILEQEFLQDDFVALLSELRTVLKPAPAIPEISSSQQPFNPAFPANQPNHVVSPSKQHHTSSSSGRTRSDSNAVLQAARSHDFPYVVSISGRNSAVFTGAVKSAVETNDTVTLSALLSATSLAGDPSGSSNPPPVTGPDEDQRLAHFAGSASVISTPADDNGAGESLLAAVVNGDIKSVRLLLRHSVAPSCRNSIMATPLAVACEAGSTEMVQLLLEVSESSVHAFDSNLRRPLHLAALSKIKEIAVLLLAAGANVHDTDINGNTALHYATLCDATGCMEVLLLAGSQVSAQNKDGSTPMHFLKGVDAAKLLTNDGQNSDAFTILDFRGRNVLHTAALSGNADLFKFLLDFNAVCGTPLSLFATDDEGSSVLHNSCKSSCDWKTDEDEKNMTMQILQFTDASSLQVLCNLIDVNDMTALHLACINGRLSSCKALLLAGADPLLQDKDGMMPLSYACLHSHRKVGEYIMSMIPKPDLPAIPDQEGVGVSWKRHSADRSCSRDSNSRASLDAIQELRDGIESLKSKVSHQQDLRWFEGSGPEVFVTFSVEVSIKDEHSIFIVGDVPPLGKWDPAAAVLLSLQDGGKCWSVTLKIKAGSSSRYKFLIAAELNGHMNGCVKRWESLETERFFEVPRDAHEGSFQQVTAKFFGSLGMDGPWLYKWTQLKLYFGSNLWAGNDHTVLDVGPENGVRLKFPVYGFEPRLLSVRCANGQFASLERPRRSMQQSFSNVSFDTIDLKCLFPICIMVSVPLQRDDVCVAVLSFEEVSRSMYGCCALPLLAPLLSVIGSVSLKYVVATPFVHAGMRGRGVNSRFQWQQMKLIGHRGVGAEKYAQATPTSTRRTHIQENTVLSFVTASKSGADFIEFDVQVTRDGHPVIHHDVAVDLGGVRIPVVSLTLQEFLVIRDANFNTQQQHVVSHNSDEASSRYRNRSLSPRGRSKSDEGMLLARSSMPITDKFPSLEEVCICVPEATGFDVEIKFPTPLEERTYGVKVDRNSFCDSVLNELYNHAGNRLIILSTFDPDVALLLRLKQPRFPVCFLTESAGPIKTPDPRRASLQQAIQWARAIHCWGIVTECWPVVNSPELVQLVKLGNHLRLLTYGTSNNDRNFVELQRRAGVDAVCVDHVSYIRKSLPHDRS